MNSKGTQIAESQSEVTKERQNFEHATLKPLNHSTAQLINTENGQSGTELWLKAKTRPLITLTKAFLVPWHPHMHSFSHCSTPSAYLCHPVSPPIILYIVFALPPLQDPINLKQRDDPWLILFMVYLPISIKLHRSNEKAVHEGNSNIVIHWKWNRTFTKWKCSKILPCEQIWILAATYDLLIKWHSLLDEASFKSQKRAIRECWDW